MSDAAQTYTPPDTASTTALPAQVAGYLDGAAGDVVIIPNLAEKYPSIRPVSPTAWPTR